AGADDGSGSGSRSLHATASPIAARAAARIAHRRRVRDQGTGRLGGILWYRGMAQPTPSGGATAQPSRPDRSPGALPAGFAAVAAAPPAVSVPAPCFHASPIQSTYRASSLPPPSSDRDPAS